uniref:Uncharacterized protein n=1 Tax=Helianthus annuus TaxID=4232 RepID=A0A251T1W7_HELAN
MLLFGAIAVVGGGKIEASTVAALGFLHESVWSVTMVVITGSQECKKSCSVVKTAKIA